MEETKLVFHSLTDHKICSEDRFHEWRHLKGYEFYCMKCLMVIRREYIGKGR